MKKPIIEWITPTQDLKIQQATFGPLNKTVIAACEDGTIREFDASVIRY